MIIHHKKFLYEINKTAKWLEGNDDNKFKFMEPLRIFIVKKYYFNISYTSCLNLKKSHS